MRLSLVEPLLVALLSFLGARALAAFRAFEEEGKEWSWIVEKLRERSDVYLWRQTRRDGRGRAAELSLAFSLGKQRRRVDPANSKEERMVG